MPFFENNKRSDKPIDLRTSYGSKKEGTQNDFFLFYSSFYFHVFYS